MARRLLWLFIFILIFVLWILTADRPWCQVLPKELATRFEEYQSQSPQNIPIKTFDSVDLYGDSTVTQRERPKAKKRTGGSNDTGPSLSELGMASSVPLQPIPRPGPTDPSPFGYDLFQIDEEDGLPSDPFATVAPDDYIVGAGDELLVNAWGRADLSFKITVDREGKVFLPEAGPVTVAGLPLVKVEESIQEALGRLYSDIELSCTLARMRTIRVFVFGEVRRPGAYTVNSAATAIDALYRAGGPNSRGSLRRVRVMRRGDVQREIDLYRFLLTGRRGDDQALRAGDVVFVPIVGPRVVARGYLRRPAIYEIQEGSTLSDLVDLAGGFAANAHAERIMIDRLGDRDGRELLDVTLPNGKLIVDDPTVNPVLKDGDDVSVFSKFELRDNLVWLVGAVKHPGAFERANGMQVSDLISSGEQLRENAYALRAELIRHVEDGRRSLMAVNLEEIITGTKGADVQLLDRDSLVVHAREDVESRSTVAIDGAVRRPGSFPLYEGMRVSDLVFLAGNPTKRAWLVHAEVARTDAHGETRVFNVALDDILRGDLAADSILYEDDHVFVRETGDQVGPSVVTIAGEVRFPGHYPLSGDEDDDRLSSLIARAGGLTSHAFPAGTVFTRAQIKDEFNRKNLGALLWHSQPVREDSTGALVREELVSFNPESMTRVIIDVPKILQHPSCPHDLVLVDGDRIHVPTVPSGVQILGAVGAPGTIQYYSGWKVKDYMKRAGGFGPNADQNRMRLIKADGRVQNSDGVMGRRVELGDAIFVPGKIERHRDWLRDLGQTMSILGGLATTVLVIDRIGN